MFSRINSRKQIASSADRYSHLRLLSENSPADGTNAAYEMKGYGTPPGSSLLRYLSFAELERGHISGFGRRRSAVRVAMSALAPQSGLVMLSLSLAAHDPNQTCVPCHSEQNLWIGYVALERHSPVSRRRERTR